MGIRLSVHQKGALQQLKNILADVRFSNKRLTKFICWVSREITDCDLEDINSVSFWDNVGKLLTLKVENGENKVSLFIPIFLQARKKLLEAENSRQQISASPVPEKQGGLLNSSQNSAPQIQPPSLYPPLLPVSSQQYHFNSSKDAVVPFQGSDSLSRSLRETEHVEHPGSRHVFPPPPHYPFLSPIPAPTLYPSPNPPPPDPSPQCLPLPPSGRAKGEGGRSLASVDGGRDSEGRLPACSRGGGSGPSAARAQDLGPRERREELPVAGPQGGGGTTTAPDCLGNGEAARVLATQNNDQESIPSVAPVVYVGKRHVRKEHKPFSYQDKIELCKVQRQFGRSSEIFKGMIKATFTSNEMVPSDIKDLFRCLLTPSEYDLWEGLWKKSLRTVLQEIQQTPDAQDSDYNDITHSHLCGEGDFSSADEQTRLLSKTVLDKISNAAEKAFYQIPTTESKSSYVNIKQFPSENFLQFVDRLRTQVERQVQDPVVQAELIKEMAQRNANETCRRIILSLPLDPSPSLAQMIEACARRAELFSAPERNPGLTHPKPVAAATPGPKRQPMSSNQLQHIICHRCKRPGHFAKACPQNQKQKSNKQKN